MEDARMEWNGRFQEWNGRQSSIPIPYYILCNVFREKYDGRRVVINNTALLLAGAYLGGGHGAMPPPFYR